MTTTASSDKLLKDLRTAMADVETLLSDSVDAGSERFSEIRDRAQASLHRAQDEVVRRARDAGQQTDRYVHEHPWTTIAAAASIAFLAGLLLARR
ncbi:MAG TPA: DUF883 family protein [Steroidobacteraceae bacterium]|nr:DUF883 family protein [Steroidobacteraceae bacterium]HRX87825.1 DUF883 family protein [Steroidobacteraceae bacterium]